jgi:signal transduction histidine kinase
LPADVEAAAYRIVQEALTNVVRHADAHHTDITLAASDSRLTVTVTTATASAGRAATAPWAWPR